LPETKIGREAKRKLEEYVMSIGKVCVRTVVTVRPEENVTAAAKRMREYNVGALVVVEGKQPVGIVTDRDLVVRVLAAEGAPKELEVGAVMSRHLVCVPEYLPLEEAMNLMRGYEVRRLVVVNEARELVGIFALDDMLELLGEEQAAIARLLRSMRGLEE
jgi:CBS domain-containing protein